MTKRINDGHLGTSEEKIVFSRTLLSFQTQQSPAVTFWDCINNFPLLVPRGLGRGCGLLHAESHHFMKNKPQPAC